MDMFTGPIPGESLTREPGNAPWEQPPQYAKVEEVVAFYLDKFEDDETLEDFLNILDNDAPLDLIVDTMLLTGEMHGIHTTDASLIAGPIIHEHLLGLAEAAGVKVREFQGKDKKQKQKEKEIQDVQMHLDFNRPYEPEPEPMMEAPVEEIPAPRGLMARRT
jgi:hypothetical protein